MNESPNKQQVSTSAPLKATSFSCFNIKVLSKHIYFIRQIYHCCTKSFILRLTRYFKILIVDQISEIQVPPQYILKLFYDYLITVSYGLSYLQANVTTHIPV